VERRRAGGGEVSTLKHKGGGLNGENFVTKKGTPEHSDECDLGRRGDVERRLVHGDIPTSLHQQERRTGAGPEMGGGNHHYEAPGDL